MLKYILMHREIPVCDIEISDVSSSIEKIIKLHNPEHLPLATLGSSYDVDLKKLNKWYKGRSIPASRSGLRDALDIIGVEHSDDLILKCYGLSLSDQYWLKPFGSDLDWDNINFFENDFSEDVGNALFGNQLQEDFSLVSPDNTSDGWLKKRWSIIDDKRCLIKAGSAPYYQEPLNEKIASVLQKQLNHMPFVNYDLIYDDGKPLSVCENFLTAETELVSAYSIYQSFEKDKNTSPYNHFCNCCDKLSVPDTKKFLDYMFVVDFIIANNDRHLRNFGVIRNSKTLKWIGFAPVFDCGTSLWYDKIAKNIKPIKYEDSKPFEKKHSQQIKLATDLSWIDFSKLECIYDETNKILSKSDYIDNVRRDNICYGINYRIEMLKNFINTI